ncbi:MAG: hypothetical protein AAF066_16565 [Pseudomonadota bacterium]
MIKTCLFAAHLTFAASVSLASDVANVEINGVDYLLEITSCASADSHYFIDARGENTMLSVVGALAGENQYSTVDFFYVEDGEDLRAGTTTEAIKLQNGKFEFTGQAKISNDTTADMSVEADAC